VRADRDAAAVEAALRALRADCERSEVNAMPAIITAVRTRATLGEMCGAMRETFGEYKPV
jgi:methylmalonyl-CoA mutase N-terminal domain/subunit